jgi:glycerol-1-phosphate dehydrogenase [NAD(P)+]
MTVSIPTYSAPDIVPDLIAYARLEELNAFMLVADRNTHRVLGERVAAGLRAQGWDVREAILTSADVVPDETSLVEVLVAADTKPRTYLGVGGGTVTDIARFCSHRTGNPFLSLPTAPSVDGFASIGSALVLKRTKRTINGQPPAAVFADLDTLCRAPGPMIAAGFGDMLGKFTSLADWRLGGLLWNEPFDAAVCRETRQALQACVDLVSEIGAATCTGIESLLNGLVESGVGMVKVGSSRPAGGSEHHLSHFWEMKLLAENRPAILHGAKVGTATVIIAGFYAQVRGMSRTEAAERLAATAQPDPERDAALIRAVYGAGAEGVLADQSPFLDLSATAYAALQQRALDRWTEIQEIAAMVPPPDVLAGWLYQAGGAADPRELGLDDIEIAQAIEAAHLLRNRFTIFKLCRLLGLHG